VGIGLANLVNATDPEAFVIGGGVVDDADCFVGSVEARMAEATYSSDRRRLPRVLAAQLGSRAGAIGAALLCRD
jgi:glucokinase